MSLQLLHVHVHVPEVKVIRVSDPILDRYGFEFREVRFYGADGLRVSIDTLYAIYSYLGSLPIIDHLGQVVLREHDRFIQLYQLPSELRALELGG